MPVQSYLHDKNLPTIKQLQCFLMVAEELNFRQAAEQLNMTQPPLTRQIRCLEEVIGTKLFVRNTHEVLLTKTGEQLVDKAQAILLATSDLKEMVSSQSKQIRLGYTRNINFGNIPTLMKRIHQISHHQLANNHQWESLTSNQLLVYLKNHKIDIALVGEKGKKDDHLFEFQWIYQEPVMLAMPASHPASHQPAVDISHVADLPLYWFERKANPAYYDKCEPYFASLDCNLTRIAELPDTLSMLARIAKGKGIHLIPQSYCQLQQSDICYRPLTDNASQYLNIDVYLAYRKDEQNPNILQAVQMLWDTNFSNEHNC